LWSPFFWDVALHHWVNAQQEFFLDTLTPEDMVNTLSQNIGHHIPEVQRLPLNSKNSMAFQQWQLCGANQIEKSPPSILKTNVNSR
jgi:hypothetical protein